MLRSVLLLIGLALVLPAQAQVFRWVDQNGRVHYSDAPPSLGARASVVGPANGGVSSALVVQPRTMYSQQVAVSEPAVAAPTQPRGLDFRKYVSLQRGMTDGELLTIAGEPDHASRDRSFKTYTYLPTPGDPFVTTINLVRGRISEIERTRKF